MRSFVIFQDSKVFSKDQIWDLGQVLLKYKNTDVKIYCVGEISVKASNDKTLQKGTMVQAESVSEAIEIFEKIKGLSCG